MMCSHRVVLSVVAVGVLGGIAPAQVVEPERMGGYLYRLHEPDGRVTQLRARTDHSVAREWNEVLLTAIRNDKARPTVHARNLYHISAAMWDAWAAYDEDAGQVFHQEKLTPPADPAALRAARETAIAYAAYRVLVHRFTDSVGAEAIIAACNAQMAAMSLNANDNTTVGTSAVALGNRIGETVIAFGAVDGAWEQIDYANLFYQAVNEPLIPTLPGNPTIMDPNRWQPLALEFFLDQNDIPIPFGSLEFLSPEWGNVTPFSLQPGDATVHQRDGIAWPVYHDPGPPPMYGLDDYYHWGFEMVAVWSGHLDPATGVMIDVSPRNFGNTVLPQPGEYEAYYDFLNGGDWGIGRDINPVTGAPYAPQEVPMGDYSRILAEFWADGPQSETPPGHWFTIMNYVFDHPLFEKRFGGVGPVLDDLEWDVKAYLTLGGAMHDVAVTAWGCKGYYDYVRPVSAIRYLADRGQRSDPGQPSYHPGGITLYPGVIEVVTEDSIAQGRHAHLAGEENANVGKIAINGWRGPDYIEFPATDVAGVGWILAENWWPYQRPSFVTPPFAGYVSGHSTFSRAAAELMTRLTGSEYFPGGMGEFYCPQNEFLVFEDGPSVDVTLQWATYRDASDQTSMSRIWGGIHPPADDLPGRHMGIAVGVEAFEYAAALFGSGCLPDVNADGVLDLGDINAFVALFLASDPSADTNGDGVIDLGDINTFVSAFLAGC
ncbi:MAG: GC-type dockerin domain-anchored protein [Phycisphaerales bacterium JB040]